MKNVISLLIQANPFI